MRPTRLVEGDNRAPRPQPRTDHSVWHWLRIRQPRTPLEMVRMPLKEPGLKKALDPGLDNKHDKAHPPKTSGDTARGGASGVYLEAARGEQSQLAPGIN